MRSYAWTTLHTVHFISYHQRMGDNILLWLCLFCCHLHDIDVCFVIVFVLLLTSFSVRPLHHDLMWPACHSCWEIEGTRWQAFLPESLNHRYGKGKSANTFLFWSQCICVRLNQDRDLCRTVPTLPAHILSLSLPHLSPSHLSLPLSVFLSINSFCADTFSVHWIS